MGKFYHYTGNTLIQTGSCPDGDEQFQVIPGLQLGLGDPPPTLTVRAAPPPDYTTLRFREYPSIGDQLDAIWKLIGPTSPANSDARAIYDQIVGVKSKYPKPPG